MTESPGHHAQFQANALLFVVLGEVFEAFLLTAQPVLPDNSGTATDLAELSNLGIQTSIVTDWHPISLFQASDLIYKSSGFDCRFIVNTLPPRVTNSQHADDLAAWTSAEHTSKATHVMQETINRVSSWADKWCMEISCSKTQATLLSLSTVKEKVMLKLEDMLVPQVDNPTFLGVTLYTCLTWKTHLEAVAARSVRKLGLLKELAGTTWGADTSILRRVYTGAARPIMEYATTSWATTSSANKSKLDKVQNVALRAIVGAMKTTPIKEMGKRADLKPLEL